MGSISRRGRVVRVLVLLIVTCAGLAAVAISAYYVLQDWPALSHYYARFEEAAMSGADQRSLFIAEAQQNVFRINCFADGVGVLLGGIIAAIGIHGLCLLGPVADRRQATED